jgi:hypothetical protein
MSSEEIRNQLKKNIDKLSDSEVRLAAGDFNLYFEYLKARKEMPANKKLSFTEYVQLINSLTQAEKSKTVSASKLFETYKKQYGFGL